MRNAIAKMSRQDTYAMKSNPMCGVAGYTNMPQNAAFNYVVSETDKDRHEAECVRKRLEGMPEPTKSLQRCAFFGQALLVDIGLACKFHLVWFVIAFSFYAMTSFAIMRRKTRECLTYNDPIGASAACRKANVWFIVLLASLMAIVVIEFWGIYKWIDHLNS